MESLYLLVAEYDVTPRTEGPFFMESERLERARQIRREEGEEHGLFALDIDFEKKTLESFSFSNAALEDDDV
jgi:hypothetical protein